MKNLDMPATAQSFAMTEGECGTAMDFLSDEGKYIGFTKREQACITLGVPETGDPELDALILKSERKRIATICMAAWITHHGAYSSIAAAKSATEDVDALLEELSK